MPPSPTVSHTGELWSHHRITVASLCCDTIGTASGPIGDYHLSGSRTFSKSDTATNGVACHLLGHPNANSTLPSLASVHQKYHNDRILQHDSIGCLDTAKSTYGTRDAVDSTNDDTSYLDSSMYDASNIYSDTTQRHERLNGMAVSFSSTVPTSSNSGIILHARHKPRPKVGPNTQAASIEMTLLRQIPRLARPFYTEQQKFFIMYHRIIRGSSWPKIGTEFARFFNLRSKDGLTSVYYRIRKEWGMKEVLKTSSSTTDDRRKVMDAVRHFQKDFLVDLGDFN